MDRISPEKRSNNMARVRGANTKPEKIVRSALYKKGCRFRLHSKDLIGKPDIVIPKQKIAIFVHGCFWHQHKNCSRATRPTSNKNFWNTKLDKNMVRDAKVQKELQALGWKVFTIWECQTKTEPSLTKALRRILNVR
jgi:DNA mismatch endonuclease (patch repair protein)